MLNCPACATVNSAKRLKGTMSFDTFKFLLDDIDWNIKRINFSYAGEPLVNPDLFKMVRYARDRGIDSIVETNGMLLGDSINELLESGLDKLNIAFDGTNQENISRYRAGIKFDTVLTGIRHLTLERARRHLQVPQIHLQFIVMKHNQDYMDEAIKMAGELGVDFIDFKSMILSGGLGLSKETKRQLALEYLPNVDEFLRYELIGDEWQLKKSHDRFCTHILSDTVIMWNGDVTICTMDVQGDLVLGNIFESPLRKIWISNKYRDIRKKVFSKNLEACKECGYFLSDFKCVKVKDLSCEMKKALQ